MPLQGTGAPSDTYPYELCLGNTRTNTWQLLPYMSTDMEEYTQIFDHLILAFHGVFLWIDNVVRLFRS